jgi:hypothetical protein
VAKDRQIEIWKEQGIKIPQSRKDLSPARGYDEVLVLCFDRRSPNLVGPPKSSEVATSVYCNFTRLLAPYLSYCVWYALANVKTIDSSCLVSCAF